MFARTPRLMLRPAWSEDARALLRAFADEAIVRNLTRAPWPYRLSDAEAFIAGQQAAALPSLLVFRRAPASPELVGGIGLMPAEGGTAELGYWIARGHWGQGYASEAGRAMIAVARDALRLEGLVAGHFLDNPASGRVLHKLGFKPTGNVRPRHSAGRGEAVPCAEFQLDLAAAVTGGPVAQHAMMAA